MPNSLRSSRKILVYSLEGFESESKGVMMGHIISDASLFMGARGGVCGTSNISPLSLEVYKNFIVSNLALFIDTETRKNPLEII